MKVWWWILVGSAGVAAISTCRTVASISANSSNLTAERRTVVENDVRRFTAAVARDVTSEGPIAWRKYFADEPQFFMAVDGTLVFPDGQSAAKAIPQIASQFKRIELHWGDDLRLDPLTDSLCNVATSYTEKIELQPGASGPQGAEVGYFTGIAENRNGQWQFRNAHWSQPLPASAPK